MKEFLSKSIKITRLEGLIIFAVTIGFTVIAAEVHFWLGLVLLVLLGGVAAGLGLAKAEK